MMTDGVPMRYDRVGTDALGAAIANGLRPGDVVGLVGDLGAGKTSFARAMLSALGLAEEAPSPSFAIVQPYAPPEVSLAVLHVDLYRIKNPEEITELGLNEARRDHVLLIEWPERLGRHRFTDMLILGITWPEDPADDDARVLTATIPPAWEGRWPFPK
jgi:tRNA threonylcarbamoyladenosine biosynthesis protein TsaE